MSPNHMTDSELQNAFSHCLTGETLNSKSGFLVAKERLVRVPFIETSEFELWNLEDALAREKFIKDFNKVR